MSVTRTRDKGRRSRFPGQVGYTRFERPEGESPTAEAARQAHQQWLLANMDWFAAQGRGAVVSASVALQRSFGPLPPGPAGPLAQLTEESPGVGAMLEQQQRLIDDLTKRVMTCRRACYRFAELLPECLTPVEYRAPEGQKSIDNLMWWVDELKKV